MEDTKAGYCEQCREYDTDLVCRYDDFWKLEFWICSRCLAELGMDDEDNGAEASQDAI